MSLFDINVMLGPATDAAEPSFRAADDLLREMDRLGIAEALVYSSHARYAHPQEGNRQLLEQIGGHRDRLHPCWVLLPPGTAEQPSPVQIVRQMRENGVRAARMFPKLHLFPVSRRILSPLLTTLEGEAIPLIVDLERRHWSEISPWDAIFDLCEAHPRLPVVLLREGGTTPRLLYHAWDTVPNLHLETSYIQSARCIEEICERFGTGRLLFGSGIPAFDASGALASLQGSALSDRQRADIAGNNARRLLKLDPGPAKMRPDWPVGTGGLRVWDAHGHLGPWYKAYYPVHDATGTVERMDEAGIERLVVSDIKSIENDPDAGNARSAAACADFPGRIYAYAGYAPGRYADDIAAFERALDRPGVVGIKFHCSLHQTPPESPLYRPAFEVANERRLPILTHGVLPPDLLREALTEFPNLIYIAAHYAAGPPEGNGPLIALANEFSNLYLDSTGSIIQHGAFARLLNQMPVEQILYGADFPIMDFPYQLGRVRYAEIDDAVKQKILWENPERIFRRV